MLVVSDRTLSTRNINPVRNFNRAQVTGIILCIQDLYAEFINTFLAFIGPMHFLFFWLEMIYVFTKSFLSGMLVMYLLPDLLDFLYPLVLWI